MGTAGKTFGWLLILVGAFTTVCGIHGWQPLFDTDWTFASVLHQNVLSISLLAAGAAAVVIGLVVRLFAGRALPRRDEGEPVPDGLSALGKSLDYTLAAVFFTALAVTFQPAPIRAPQEDVGARLFPDFSDPTAAAGLEIVRYDKNQDRNVAKLKIVNDGGVWSIASHKGYPADATDAEKRIRETALKLMDLEVLGIASEIKSDHPKFGVVDPTDENENRDDENAGILITVRNAKGRNLARLIIGKKVRDAQDQRFVRKPGQDRVYAVKLDVEKLSSKFEDWIKTDLLDLSRWDVKNVILKDYTFDQQVGMTPDGRMVAVPDFDERLDVTLTYSDTDPKWKLDKLLENRNDKLTESRLLENEELNTEKLDGLLDALDDLKIVDVVAKPKGLTADLKAGKGLLENAKAAQSLVDCGFYPVRTRTGDVMLLSSDGEVRVNTKKEVQYVLRFGQVAGFEEGREAAKLNRYLLVSAQVNEDAFPPQTESKTESKTAPDDTAGKTDKAADKTDDTTDKTQDTTDKTDKTNDSTDSAADAGDNPGSAGDDADDAKDEDPAPKPNDAMVDGDNGDKDKDNAAEDKEKEKNAEDKEADQQKKKREEAEKRVKELNKRFAGWYYVISEDVYKKVHLGRFDIIKEKEGVAADIDKFRDLEKGPEKKDGDNDASSPTGDDHAVEGAP